MAGTPSNGHYEGNPDTLIFAHVLFRHGARNIAATYPNDPYKDESHWPEGFGQLIKEGKLQHYLFGQYLRRRYNHLIDEAYSPDDIYVLSTDFDRTLMSAAACLSGLYPPSDKEKFDPDINWQPIPVHTVPLRADQILSTGALCPQYENAHDYYMINDPEMIRIRNENVELFDHWSKHTGLEINKSLDVVNLLYNTLIIQKEQNKPLAEWAEEAIKPGSPMEYIANKHFQSYSATPQLARLKQGFLIKDIMERFKLKVKGELKPDRKLWLYSAHDLTIVSILNALGMFEPHFPNYAASVHFELFRTDKGEYYFQIFYRESGEEYPKPMNIPGCGKNCTLEKFYELFGHIIPGDFEDECGALPPMDVPSMDVPSMAPSVDYVKRVDFLDLL